MIGNDIIVFVTNCPAWPVYINGFKLVLNKIVIPASTECQILTDNPVTTKHLCDICTMLDQRRRRWVDIVQMLYKCFEFAGNAVE